jgi:hypothetical protein
LIILGHIFTFKHLCLHSITKILRNGPKAHFPFTSTTRGQSAASVVSSSVFGSLAQLALAQLPVPPPTAGRSVAICPPYGRRLRRAHQGTAQDVACR